MSIPKKYSDSMMRRVLLSNRLLADAHDETLLSIRRYLPPRTNLWPETTRVENEDCLDQFRIRGDMPLNCWICGSRAADVHHIIGGTKGRSHEWGNLVLACRDCHDKIHGSHVSLAQVLKAKWANDRWTMSWLRLTLLNRKYLPEVT